MTAYTISGPGVDRPAPCLNSAVIAAQRAAEQTDEAGVTFYVRENGETVCHVERDDRGTVWTTPR